MGEGQEAVLGEVSLRQDRNKVLVRPRGRAPLNHHQVEEEIICTSKSSGPSQRGGNAPGTTMKGTVITNRNRPVLCWNLCRPQPA